MNAALTYGGVLTGRLVAVGSVKETTDKPSVITWTLTEKTPVLILGIDSLGRSRHHDSYNNLEATDGVNGILHVSPSDARA
jgi:hypothetical protein